MTETVIYVRASRDRIRSIIYASPETAKQSDRVLRPAGEVALTKIHKAFLVKSRGETDETGDRWAPLARTTLLKKARRLNPTSEADRPSAGLNSEQRETWWARYRSALAKYHDKGTAAKIAWAQLKHLMGEPKFDKYGTAALILRDSDTLLRSFELGALHNIFRISAGTAEIGTDRPGATAHHSGAKNLPQRRLWPDPRDWNSLWWDEILVAARDGLIQLLIEELK